MSQPVGIVLLAAGGSSRMGEPKQLLAIDGKTLLCRAAETAIASVSGPAVAVLGANAARLRAELLDLPIAIAENPDWASGMGSSIAAGMRALIASASQPLAGAVLMLCDQPGVTPEIIRSLVSRFCENRESIIASAYGGVFGAPALFPNGLFPDLLALKGAEGARILLQKRRDIVLPVPFPAGAVDIDTPEDYYRLCKSST